MMHVEMYGNGPELQCTHSRDSNATQVTMISPFQHLMIGTTFSKEDHGFPAVTRQPNILGMRLEDISSNMLGSD